MKDHMAGLASQNEDDECGCCCSLSAVPFLRSSGQDCMAHSRLELSKYWVALLTSWDEEGSSSSSWERQRRSTLEEVKLSSPLMNMKSDCVSISMLACVVCYLIVNVKQVLALFECQKNWASRNITQNIRPTITSWEPFYFWKERERFLTLTSTSHVWLLPAPFTHCRMNHDVASLWMHH